MAAGADPVPSADRKIDGKTVTWLLTADQLADYQDWFVNQRQLRSFIAELEASAWPSPTRLRWQR